MTECMYVFYMINDGHASHHLNESDEVELIITYVLYDINR